MNDSRSLLELLTIPKGLILWQVNRSENCEYFEYADQKYVTTLQKMLQC
jgi:hypothetical protein